MVDVDLHRGSSEPAHIIWLAAPGGKYSGGSAVGVGFGQRGSSGIIPGPHFNGTFESHLFEQRR